MGKTSTTNHLAVEVLISSASKTADSVRMLSGAQQRKSTTVSKRMLLMSFLSAELLLAADDRLRTQ